MNDAALDERQLDALAINTIRALSMDAVQAANSGHPGTPMALAPLGWAIFSKLRKHDPKAPEWSDRDRFVLSCGHASMLQYSLLHLSGYDLSLKEIKNFRQWGSLTPGHPEVKHTPGVEITTGPLGQGIATAVGMAMAERHLASRFNKDGRNLVDHFTWVIASDGDIMEGVSAEAASLAGHLQLGKLIVFWDDNRITIDGGTELSFSEDVLARYAACGWQTLSVDDGEDVAAIVAAAEQAKSDPRPSFIRVRTIIGFPSPNKQNKSDAHGAPLGADEITATKAVMNWPNEAFYVPDEIGALRQKIVERGAASRKAWTAKVDAFKQANSKDADRFLRAMQGDLPAGWDSDLPKFDANEKGMATRKAGGTVLNAIAQKHESLVGGSADLAASNNTHLAGGANFLSGSHGVPRNVDWGIREHAMGAAVNGMALHGGGITPFGATFLVFSDYMRPALRLAALMQLNTRYVFTHDSIGLGEDGPTHQPVEHLAALRAIPGFAVFRPCDANETRECWKAAMRWQGPAALALTRQNVPTLDRNVVAPAENAAKGGYILKDCVGTPKAVIVATGSEVHLALEAQAILEKDGVATRVVSMPCVELFAVQDDAYRNKVIPRDGNCRVLVEAGISQGWERWVGSDAKFVTIDHFGASAPAEELFERFGFSAKNIVSLIKDARR
ncbi:MAG: transketolase [Polyangiales bacterium]